MMIKAYKYNTKSEAVEAQLKIDKYYGIPKTPTSVSQHWTGYNYSELDNFYYIPAHSSLIPVLGEPIEFDLTLPEMN